MQRKADQAEEYKCKILQITRRHCHAIRVSVKKTVKETVKESVNSKVVARLFSKPTELIYLLLSDLEEVIPECCLRHLREKAALTLTLATS